MTSTHLLKILKDAGWTEDRQKGSHLTLKHPDIDQIITVPHPKKDLGVGIVARILKIAGLNQKEGGK